MSVRHATPALVAALLFGASTPLAKHLGVEVPALMLAGLLYLGSGLGLALLLIWRWMRRPNRAPVDWLHIPASDRPWLAGAIVAGGVLGPVLLMQGLTLTSAQSAALLLNVEGVLTALLAWWVFRENADRRIVVGMGAIVAGGVLLSWQPDQAEGATGAVFIIGACLCWAIDNNLMRKASANDAVLLACMKGLGAGICNTGLALLTGGSMPAVPTLLTALGVGFAGYGLSLALFVLALRNLGTARTGAYFSVAPLFGVLLAFLWWPQWPHWTFWAATLLMAWGVWLHLSERHDHQHTHEPLTHRHWHRHDDVHHQHTHDTPESNLGTHAHWHHHEPLTHRHPHYPDVHHRHGHH